MKQHTRKLGLAAAVAAAALLVFALVLFILTRAPTALSASDGPSAEARLVRIEKGSSAAGIAAMLRDKGLIRSAPLFQAILRLTGADRKLKAGSYRIPPGSSMPAIIALLAEGKISQIQVTVPEGYTARAMGLLFEKKGICSLKAFQEAVADSGLAADLGIPAAGSEGFLFPDTYLFAENAEARDIVRSMVNTFLDKLELIAPQARLDKKTLYDNVILASIVEREYRAASEAGLIASVFKNRLAIGMPLQSCATVVYIITEKLDKPHPAVVYYSDLAIRGSYNTYLHRGLPPGPISNPGATALRAVFDSPKSDYLYFRLVDASLGLHRFSRDFDEHKNGSIPVKGF